MFGSSFRRAIVNSCPITQFQLRTCYVIYPEIRSVFALPFSISKLRPLSKCQRYACQTNHRNVTGEKKIIDYYDKWTYVGFRDINQTIISVSWLFCSGNKIASVTLITFFNSCFWIALIQISCTVCCYVLAVLTLDNIIPAFVTDKFYWSARPLPSAWCYENKSGRLG